MLAGATPATDAKMSMSDDGNRLPPDVIHVPAPALSLGSQFKRHALLVAGLVAFMGSFLCLFFLVIRPGVLANNANAPAWLLRLPEMVGYAGLASALILGFSIPFAWRRAIREEAAAKIEEDPEPQTNSHPAGKELSDAWSTSRRMPKLAAIQACLRRHPPSVHTAGRIVILGDFDVPEIKDDFFEPIILTPTQMVWNRLLFGLIGVVLIALGMLGFVGLIPPDLGWIFLSGGVGHLVLAGCLWFWRNCVRPAYIRLAPGIVELLRYPALRERKPKVRSYPIDDGVLVVVANKLRMADYVKSRQHKLAGWRKKAMEEARFFGMTITLVRDSQKDRIRLTYMQDAGHVLESLWRAILSTARRPIQSDQDLIA